MAKKASSSGVNKSAEVRELLERNPEIKAAEVIATLAQKGIKIDLRWQRCKQTGSRTQIT